MCDKYDEHAKEYFPTENEFKLDRIRNYFSSIKNYFEIRRKLEEGNIPEDKKEGIQKMLDKFEKQCHEDVYKISQVLKSNN